MVSNPEHTDVDDSGPCPLDSTFLIHMTAGAMAPNASAPPAPPPRPPPPSSSFSFSGFSTWLSGGTGAGRAWQILLATSQNTISLNKRGFTMRWMT